MTNRLEQQRPAIWQAWTELTPELKFSVAIQLAEYAVAEAGVHRDDVTGWLEELRNGTSSTSTTASLTSLTDSLDDEYLDLNVWLDDDAALADARDVACARARAVNALLDVARGIPEDAVYEAIASMEAARHFPDPSPVDAEVEQMVRSARAR